MRNEKQKLEDKEKQQKLNTYLLGRPPKIVGDVATFQDSRSGKKTYKVIHSGWRKMREA